MHTFKRVCFSPCASLCVRIYVSLCDMLFLHVLVILCLCVLICSHCCQGRIHSYTGIHGTIVDPDVQYSSYQQKPNRCFVYKVTDITVYFNLGYHESIYSLYQFQNDILPIIVRSSTCIFLCMTNVT